MQARSHFYDYKNDCLLLAMPWGIFGFHVTSHMWVRVNYIRYSHWSVVVYCMCQTFALTIPITRNFKLFTNSCAPWLLIQFRLCPVQFNMNSVNNIKAITCWLLTASAIVYRWSNILQRDILMFTLYYLLFSALFRDVCAQEDFIAYSIYISISDGTYPWQTSNIDL